jgi:hypothetical protein
MARRFLALASVLLGLVVILPGPSSAHTVSVGTKVSKSKLPRGPVGPGQRVIIFGRVGAADTSCVAGVPVELIRRVPGPDRVLQVDVTDSEGEYFFLRRPRTDQRVYVRFAGSHVVVTGHDHTCGGSVSPQFRLRVQR